MPWRFLFSYYGFATAFFVVIWVVAIMKHLHWWEYACIALLNCIAYIKSRDDWNWGVKLLLLSQLLVLATIIIALIAVIIHSVLR